MGNHDFHPPFVRLHHALSMPDGTDEICGASVQFGDAPAEAQLHPVGGCGFSRSSSNRGFLSEHEVDPASAASENPRICLFWQSMVVASGVETREVALHALKCEED